MRPDYHKFSLTEATSNSKGKTSMALLIAPVVIITGCAMGVIGAFSSHPETAFHGLGFVTVGGTLLGIRRFTQDKPLIPDTGEPENLEEKIIEAEVKSVKNGDT